MAIAGTPTGRRIGHWFRDLGPGVLGVWLLLAVFLMVRLVLTHGPGGFPVGGAQFVHPDAPSELRRYTTSYDGQFVYRFALDPFTRLVTDHGITLDLPAYRQQRIATPLAAYLITLMPLIGPALALVLVNAGAVVLATWAASALVCRAGRSSWWAGVLAIPACIPISLGRDLTEPLGWAAILVALHATGRDRRAVAAVALTIAVLSRETSLVVVGGLGLYQLWRCFRREPSALSAVCWLAVPASIELGWQLWLAHVWGGGLPMVSGASANGGAPLLGIAQHFAAGLSSGATIRHGLAVTYLIERIVLLSLLVGAAVAVKRCRSTAHPGEIIAWGAAALLALSLRNWGPDVAFLRATYEAWGLSALLLICTRERWADVILRAAGSVTIGVAVLYAVRI